MSTASTSRVIWQYWETRHRKPRYIDGLRELAVLNGGCELRLVSPENLLGFLPDLPSDVLRIKQLAHKADMIRSMLLLRYGGMWLDSDALVIRDLNWMFDLLQTHEFVCFNDDAKLNEHRPWVRVNCIVSRQGSRVAEEWVKRQHAMFPRVKYKWEETGTDMLHQVCLEHHEMVKVLNFDLICPVPWKSAHMFDIAGDASCILDKCSMVMLSNAVLHKNRSRLINLNCREISELDTLLGAIMRGALRGRRISEPPGRKFSSMLVVQV